MSKHPVPARYGSLEDASVEVHPLLFRRILVLPACATETSLQSPQTAQERVATAVEKQIFPTGGQPTPKHPQTSEG